MSSECLRQMMQFAYLHATSYATGTHLRLFTAVARALMRRDTHRFTVF